MKRILGIRSIKKGILFGVVTMLMMAGSFGCEVWIKPPHGVVILGPHHDDGSYDEGSHDDDSSDHHKKRKHHR